MPTPATPSAPSESGAPASHQGNEDPISSGNTILRDTGLTDLLREFIDSGDAPARLSKDTPTPDAEDPEPDAPEAVAEDPAPGAEPADERAKLEGESDAEFEARLAELDAAAEAASEDSTEDAAKDKVSPALQKRFGELTGKIKAQEAEISRLKAATPARPASSLEEVVQGAMSDDDLSAAQRKFEDWEELALSHPDGYDQAGENGAEATHYSAEQMRALLIQARRALRLVPKQAAFIAQARQADTEAHKAFPAFNDPDSALSKAYAEIVQRSPGLVRSVPDLKLFIADAMRGRALRTKGTAPALPGRPVAKPVAQPPAVRGAPIRSVRAVDSRAQQRTALRQKAESTGSFHDLEAAIESKFSR